MPVHADAEPVSYVGALALDLSFEDGITHGRAELQPEMFAPGTERLRLGVLATLVDMVAGFPPTGPINPTVDLRVSLLARPPSAGTIFLVCHPAKVGRRLFVGETIVHTGDATQPFARSTVTFMNQPMAHEGMGAPPPEAIGAASFDDMLRPRFRDARTVEMDAHPWVSNGPAGTIQGGAQALLAEIAAERALEPQQLSAVDLDIRFLNRMRSGPVAATAEVSPGDLDGAFVRVAVTDLGDDDRLVSVVTLICRP
jgi:acyl-coenzyme A thioesterase PaaI-like protein